MRTINIYAIRKAVDAAPEDQKLAVLNGYWQLMDILNEPTPGTEPTIENGVDIIRLNEAVNTMRPGEHKPAEITKAYGGNPKSPSDRKKIMDEVKAGNVARLQYTKPVRSTLVLLPPSAS